MFNTGNVLLKHVVTLTGLTLHLALGLTYLCYRESKFTDDTRESVKVSLLMRKRCFLRENTDIN